MFFPLLLQAFRYKTVIIAVFFFFEQYILFAFYEKLDQYFGLNKTFIGKCYDVEIIVFVSIIA